MTRRIRQVAPGKLTAYARNAKTHDAAQVAEIAASIAEFGFVNPVLVTEDLQIIAGHGRVMAAEKLGLAKVPCLVITGLSEEQVRAYVIADNKIAENAGWDHELLRLELGELRDAGFDISVTGWRDAELAELFVDGGEIDGTGLTGDDDLPSGSGSGVASRPGDVWLLGDHRLMCGSSIVGHDVARLMAGAMADMVWTDPPYNVAYEGGAPIENDDLPDQEFREFLDRAFDLMAESLKPGGGVYVAHADTEGLNFRGAFMERFHISGCLVWVKSALVLGRSDYQWRHEPILYGWKTGAPHRWFGGRKQTTVREFEQPPFVIRDDGSVEIELGGSSLVISGADLQVEEVAETVLRHEKPRASEGHPTMKPVDLVLQMLKNSSQRGDVVLDPFGGSGSTLIAAEKCGRAARLMEFEPSYCDLIVRRWQDWTGRLATRESDGASFNDLANAA